MKKMGCTQVFLIVVALSAVIFGLLYVIISPAVKSMTEDAVIRGIGNYETEKYYSSDNLNYTCYRKYVFESVNQENLEKSQHLQKITPEAMEVLSQYEADFSRWIKKHSVAGYDFDMSKADMSDYYYIYSVEDPAATENSESKYMSYTVYIFDTETGIIHKLEYKQDLYK